MEPTIEYLATLLGVVDAVFAPLRDHQSPAWAGQFIAQREYHEAGARSPQVLGSDESGRQARSALVKDLGHVGLVDRCTAEGRLAGVRLTPRGYWLARRLCGRGDADLCAAMADQLWDLSEISGAAAQVTVDGTPRWAISEITLAGLELTEYERSNTPHGKRRRSIVMEELLPAIIAGQVGARADTVKMLWFWPIATRPPAVKSEHEIPDVVEPNPEAKALYWDVFRQSTQSLGDENTCGEIGPIPLPASKTFRIVGSRISWPEYFSAVRDGTYSTIGDVAKLWPSWPADSEVNQHEAET